MDFRTYFDTTLRDGEQFPGFSMNTEEKDPDGAAVGQTRRGLIEAGFPIASRGDLDAVRLVARKCAMCLFAALARARRSRWSRSIEGFGAGGVPRCIFSGRHRLSRAGEGCDSTSRTSLATRRTASKSPREAMGNPPRSHPRRVWPTAAPSGSSPPCSWRSRGLLTVAERSVKNTYGVHRVSRI